MLKKLLTRYPSLSVCAESLTAAAVSMINCYCHGGKLLLCGNGGSCADCEHISGELMKGFLKKRPLSAEQKAAMRTACPTLEGELLDRLQGGLPAVALPSLSSLNTAFANDVDPALMYAQSVLALGKPGDILLAISTSGNAANVVAAAKVAKGLGLTVIALTGAGGGRLAQLADIAVCVPETETYKVQELHLPVYHYLCASVETAFFEE